MSKKSIPTWKLEWYLMGALPARESRAIAALERSDAALRGRIDALRASNAEILAECPEQAAREAQNAIIKYENCIAGAPSRQQNRSVWNRGVTPRWAVPALACAAMLVILPVYVILTDNAIWQASDDPETATYGTRIKGDDEYTAPSLEVWRKIGNAAEMLEPNAAARAGDIIQLRYAVSKSCYGALVSIDGRGLLTVHLSGKNGKAAPLAPGHSVALKSAYRLDDAPAFEVFYLITANEIFDLESVKLKLMGANHPIGDGESLSLPKKRVTTFTLRKIGKDGAN